MNYRKFTQENITELKENEVFVFGSNLNGHHLGGAAKVALDKFGAIMGQGIGLQGQSYAIPTLGNDMQKLSLQEIEKYVLDFFEFAEDNPHLDFYVTKIGCGIAGFTIEEMQSIFYKIDLTYVFNVALPQEFCIIKGYKGYEKDMTCRGMQFKENNSYDQLGNITCCENGIHFCENPLDVLKYYSGEDKIYSHVIGNCQFDSHKNDSKIATSHIDIKTKISLSQLLEFGLNFTFKKVSFLFSKRDKLIQKYEQDYNILAGQDDNTLAGRNCNILAGKNYNTLAGQDDNTLAGRNYNILAGKNYNILAGKNYNILAGKNYNTLAGQNYNTLAGQNDNILAGQNYNTLAGQDDNTLAGRNCNILAGKNYNTLAGQNDNILIMNGTSNAMIASNGSKFKGKKGNLVCLYERKNGIIVDYKVSIIDGIEIKEDIFYKLENGKFVECE